MMDDNLIEEEIWKKLQDIEWDIRGQSYTGKSIWKRSISEILCKTKRRFDVKDIQDKYQLVRDIRLKVTHKERNRLIH